MAQQNKLGKTATKVFKNNIGMTVVQYHDTEIVKFDDDYITLNNGDYRTATTKTRMNQASSQFKLGYSVNQVKGLWYVDGVQFRIVAMIDRRTGRIETDAV